MNKIQYILSFCFVFIALQSTAQTSLGGELSGGIRAGGVSGLTFKKYNNRNTFATELVTGFNFDKKDSRGLSATLLFQKLEPFAFNEKLAVIVGGGPSLNLVRKSRFGLAGVLGFDWRFAQKFNMQLDWQPTFHFINGVDFYGLNAGFSLRYNFNR